jgi:hypothetical protein
MRAVFSGFGDEKTPCHGHHNRSLCFGAIYPDRLCPLLHLAHLTGARQRASHASARALAAPPAAAGGDRSGHQHRTARAGADRAVRYHLPGESQLRCVTPPRAVGEIRRPTDTLATRTTPRRRGSRVVDAHRQSVRPLSWRRELVVGAGTAGRHSARMQPAGCDRRVCASPARRPCRSSTLRATPTSAYRRPSRGFRARACRTRPSSSTSSCRATRQLSTSCTASTTTSRRSTTVRFPTPPLRAVATCAFVVGMCKLWRARRHASRCAGTLNRFVSVSNAKGLSLGCVA